MKFKDSNLANQVDIHMDFFLYVLIRKGTFLHNLDMTLWCFLIYFFNTDDVFCILARFAYSRLVGDG